MEGIGGASFLNEFNALSSLLRDPDEVQILYEYSSRRCCSLITGQQACVTFSPCMHACNNRWSCQRMAYPSQGQPPTLAR